MSSDEDEVDDLVAQQPYTRTVQHERILLVLRAARDQILGRSRAHSGCEDEKIARLANTLKYLASLPPIVLTDPTLWVRSCVS